MSYTLLPVVTNEVLHSFDGNRAGRRMSDYAQEIFTHIQQVNPVVARQIDNLTRNREDKLHKDSARDMWTFCTACAVYKVLESQAEANQMNEELS